MSTAAAPAEDLRVRTWLEIRAPLEGQLAPLGKRALAALALQPGERVLDVGCGVGRTPHALAQAVGPTGEVVGIDALAAAIDVLRADADLPPNVHFIAADAQAYGFPPASFDAVFSRFGVMFFDAPVAAFANLRRALRPGGRLAFVCWRDLQDNELDALPLSAAAPHLSPALVEQTACAAWLSFSDPDEIGRILTNAGFADVEIAPHDDDVSCGDLEATLAVCARVGALGKILRENPHLAPAAISAVHAALAARDGATGPALRAATWVVTAEAPG